MQLFYTRKLQEQLSEYEAHILDMTLQNDLTIDTLKVSHREEVARVTPLNIEKRWVKNKNKKGGYMEWMPHVDKCIVEMLSNRTQPSCIQANMLVMARVIHPTYELVKALPSLRYIQASRTVLGWITKALAAMRIGGAKEWKQEHTDETSRRHKSLVNLVMTIIDNDDQLKTICLSGSIISRDGTADNQARSIIGQFQESGRMLDEWRETTVEMFPGRDDLLVRIPTSNSMCVSRMLRTQTTTDTCSTAQALQDSLSAMVFEGCRELNIPEDQWVMYVGFCFQHMRNIVANGVELLCEAELTALLTSDIEVIPRHLRIQCSLSNLARMIDKEINPRGDYAKGHGGDFWHFMKTYHQGVTWLPIIRVLGGARQDGSFEAALPLYLGRRFIVQYLHRTLCSNKKENILQTNLFIVLECVEMIVQVRVASIFLSQLLFHGDGLPENVMSWRTMTGAKKTWQECVILFMRHSER